MYLKVGGGDGGVLHLVDVRHVVQHGLREPADCLEEGVDNVLCTMNIFPIPLLNTDSPKKCIVFPFPVLSY